MRDVSHKFNTYREATASAVLISTPESIERVRTGDLPKGDAKVVAKVAAVQAAKNTPQIIPYCHPVPVEFVGVDYEFETDRVTIKVTVKSVYKTGVEMEALTAASAAALNIYDLLKMVEDDVEITNIKLLEKKGGKSDVLRERAWEAAIITVSDRASKGEYEDLSGPAIEDFLAEHQVTCTHKTIVPDESGEILTAVEEALQGNSPLIITTGGTGAGPRDVTPESVEQLVEKRLPGIEQKIHDYSTERAPYAATGRPLCGIARSSVILCLPGSPKAVKESLFACIHALLHAVDLVNPNKQEDRL